MAYLDRHPECSGVCSDVDHLIPRGAGWARLPSYWSSFLGPQAPRATFRDLLVRNTVQTCSVLLRGDLARSFLRSSLSEGNYAVDDWPLFLHLTEHAPLGRMPQSLATYRRVPGSATNSGFAGNERRLVDQFRLIDDASRLIADPGTARAAGLKADHRSPHQQCGGQWEPRDARKGHQSRGGLGGSPDFAGPPLEGPPSRTVGAQTDQGLLPAATARRRENQVPVMARPPRHADSAGACMPRSVHDRTIICPPTVASSGVAGRH